jgi:hypothetical protein
MPARHIHKIGDRVHVMDLIEDETVPVGWAVIIELLPLDDFYLVQFEDDGRQEARYLE